MNHIQLRQVSQSELFAEDRERIDAEWRARVLTEENLHLIGQLLATHRPLNLVARRLGVAYGRFRRWILEGARLRWRGVPPEQDARVALHVVVCQGTAAGEEWLIDRIMEDGSMRALEFLAERRYRRNWGPPPRRLEAEERQNAPSGPPAIPHEIKVQILNQWCGGEGPAPGLRGGTVAGELSEGFLAQGEELSGDVSAQPPVP